MSPKPILIALALSIAAAVGMGQSPVLDNNRSRLPGGLGPAVACVMADLNRDGLQDLVRASRAHFGAWLQQSSGRFVPLRVTALTSAAPEIVSLAVGRITQAVFSDVLVGYRNGRVLVYPNLGGKQLGRPRLLPSIAGSVQPTLTQILVGDLDRSPGGRDEIVLILNQERPVVFTVKGATSFSQQRLSPGVRLRSPRGLLADLDRDGALDLLVVTGEVRAPTSPALYLNNRGGLRAIANAFPPKTAVAAGSLVAADVLGDGRPEIVLGPVATSAAPVRVFHNASMVPKRPVYLPLVTKSQFTVKRPRHLVAADLNGDHFDDLIAIAADGSVVYGLNAGKMQRGAFGRATVLLSAAPRSRLCAIDLEGDKDVDLLVAGAGIEDSLLLGGGPKESILGLDTEAQGMPIAARAPSVTALVDVTGEGDPDIVMWNERGVPTVLRNVEGQARFAPMVKPPVPRLPLSAYREVQAASVTSAGARDLLVLGALSFANRTKIRVVTRSRNGAMVDATARRWHVTVRLSTMTVADVSGAVSGSAGTAGLSDVVGLDAAGNIVLVVNRSGIYSRSRMVSRIRAIPGSTILVADLNFDRRPDLVVVQPRSSVRILLADARRPDAWLESTPIEIPSVTGLVAELTGDLIPDLLLSVPGAARKLVLMAGNGRGSFVNRTLAFMPKLARSARVVTEFVRIRAGTKKAVVLGFANAPAQSMVAPGRVFGAPAPLPIRGSFKIRQLLVRDLDLDGDEDLVVGRRDSLPVVLLGQTDQFTQRGVAQAGRHTSIHVALPDSSTVGALAIGWPVARVPLPGLGILRLGRISRATLFVPGPSARLVHELRLPLPRSLPSTGIPMQLITVQLKTGALRFKNLDLLRPTGR